MSQTKAQLLDPKGDVTYSGHITGVGATFSGNLDVTGNVSVGGTLTKQDVTNVDAVGLITARAGINIVGAYPLSLGTGTTIHSPDSNTLVFGTNGVERVRIGSGGLTHFKVDAASSAATQVRLENNAAAGSGANPDVAVLGYASGGAQKASIRAAVYGEGWMSFHNNNDSEKMRLLANGNLGIGTVNPLCNLHVYKGDSGAGTFDPNAVLGIENSNHAVFQFSSPSDKGNYIMFGDNDSSSVGRITYDHNINNLVFQVNAAERLRIGSSGEVGIAGANYGAAGQVIKSGGSGSSVAWGDATVGVSSAGSSIGNATTLNFIGAGNTFAVSGSTIDISIAGGGGGGGSGQFNTGLTNEFYGTASGIGSTVFTAPSTSGKKYILTSLLATNVATGNTDVNIIGAFDFNGGERSYFGYNIPLPVGMAAELLKQPMVLNPSDKVLLRSTDISRNGVDTIVEYYGTYEMQESVDLVGVGLGSATMNDTSAKTLYTSSGAPSVLQSITIANITDSGPKPISISITHGSDVIRLVENLIVPKYASVEILDNQKRISSGAIVKVTLDEGSSMGVQLSAKKISAT